MPQPSPRPPSGSDRHRPAASAIPLAAGLDPPTPRPGDGDSAEQSLADLQLIADSLTALAGFRVASIRIAHGDGLDLAVVSGSDDARRSLSRTTTPIRVLDEHVARADDWGLFKFIPADRVMDGAVLWTSDLAPTADPGAWHARDLLIAPLRDSDGTLRGTLSVDLPTDGRRPGPERRELLTRYAAQAERAILLVIEREELARQVRLAEGTRELIRRAARTSDPDQGLPEFAAGLIDLLDLTAVRVAIAQPDAGVLTRSYGEGAECPDADDPELHSVEADGLRDLWAQRRVSLVGNTVCAPLGYAETWLGALVLRRKPEASPWSDLELDTVRDLGGDLGRIIHASRTYRLQQDTVRALRELADRRGRLIDTVAHELKTPLTAIRWNLDGLALADPEAYAEMVEVIDRNRRHTRRIVTDLTVLGSVTDPSDFPAAVPVLVAPVLHEARELVGGGRPSAAATHKVVLDVSDERLAVLVAPGELERIVLNLVGNAVKYSPAGSRVTVRARALGDQVEVAVSDEGIGISAADQELLFSEFFRSTNPVALAHPGTGLGLAIVRRIVAARGGEITVDSVLGRGSVFSVFLPRALEQP